MNKEHLNILSKGIKYWNIWRTENPAIAPDLSYAHLYRDWLVGGNFDNCNLEWTVFGESTSGGCTFKNANLKHTHFMGATLAHSNFENALFEDTNFVLANLHGANLQNSNLCNLDMLQSNLTEANLSGCSIQNTDLKYANLNKTKVDNAIFRQVDLQGAQFIDTSVNNGSFLDCKIRGISVWNLEGRIKQTSNLIISSDTEAFITTDNLEIAQFISLILNNRNLTNVIESLGSKGVLIIGRFSKERKKILDLLRSALKQRNFVPMIFDFDRPTNRDFTETIKILAGISKFVIADITNPKSSPLELQSTVPDYRIPFIPIIHKNEKPFSMFTDLHNKYDWVSRPLQYDSSDNLLRALDTGIIAEAERISNKIQRKKAKKTGLRNAIDYFES